MCSTEIQTKKIYSKMDIPFFIYTSKNTENLERSKEKTAKSGFTSLDYSSDISNKLENYLSCLLFSAETCNWVNENASKFEMLNIFMICLTYEIILSINKKIIQTGGEYSDKRRTKTSHMYSEDTDPFDEKEIIYEFRTPAYERQIDYLHEGKKIERNILITNMQRQILVYSRKIKEIIAE